MAGEEAARVYTAEEVAGLVANSKRIRGEAERRERDQAALNETLQSQLHAAKQQLAKLQAEQSQLQARVLRAETRTEEQGRGGERRERQAWRQRGRRWRWSSSPEQHAPGRRLGVLTLVLP